MTQNNNLLEAIELLNNGQTEAATILLKAILVRERNNALALYSLAAIEMNSGNSAEALQLSRRGIKAAPRFSPLHFVQGCALSAMGKKKEALSSFNLALAIQPDYVEALNTSGVLLISMFRQHEALERFFKVLELEPNHLNALGNCAILLSQLKQSEQAVTMFERLVKIDPDYDCALGRLFHERMRICDWSDFQTLSEQIIMGIRTARQVCTPLAFMSISDMACDHFLVANQFFRSHCPRNDKAYWQGERYCHDRIRLAYVSPDFREHPVGHLMAGVFEQHDKSRFETIAISFGIDDQSKLRTRMLASFDRFIDVRHMESEQIAKLMRDLEIDIAVDICGYTSDSRTEIFSYRPTPIQVNYLGYPGTLGTDYFDYIIADRQVIPVEHQQYYSEKVVYLPDSYLPTDNKVSISTRVPIRGECGLPALGMVFCSFSHNHKIAPPLFEVWMRLLLQVPESVLWLMSSSEIAQRNLRKQAELRGVAPARLVFANRVPLIEDHLVRYALADLFLDTHPYNAHTTAADALMAGLPVLTYQGNAFPSRVAGSLLHAVGMPELVTHTLEQYEALALKLAFSPQLIQSLKERLQAGKGKLFDTEQFCRNLESVYRVMCD